MIDLVHRLTVPVPWSEGEKIPWNDPGFSQRMLREHLSQEHDAASRRFETIDQHIGWIHRSVLSAKPAKILDLGCGPGLYTSRLARLGHHCVGIDFSPASVAYANERAQTDKLSCSYRLQDLRTAYYGHGYDLVMLIFGEFNVFRPSEARSIIEKAHEALAQNGRLLLETHTFDAVRSMGKDPPSWYSSDGGLFSDHPHVCLTENFWNTQHNVATTRYFILDASSGTVTRYASSTQAYTDDQYRSLLKECGFDSIVFHPSFGDTTGPLQNDFVVIVCQKHTSV